MAKEKRVWISFVIVKALLSIQGREGTAQLLWMLPVGRVYSSMGKMLTIKKWAYSKWRLQCDPYTHAQRYGMETHKMTTITVFGEVVEKIISHFC